MHEFTDRTKQHSQSCADTSKNWLGIGFVIISGVTFELGH